MPGIGAFLLAHVTYIIGFLQQPLLPGWPLIPAALLVGGAFWLLTGRVLTGLRQHGEQRMRIPVMIYASALSLMWFSALTTLSRPGWAGLPVVLVSIGAGLFFLSDSILAYNRFVRPVPAGDLLVMVTYHLGQFLIAGGALALFA